MGARPASGGARHARGDGGGHVVPVVERGQVGEVGAARTAGPLAAGDLDGQAGLPGASRPRERHQPVVEQQPAEHVDVVLSAHEGRALGRERRR
ncbi:MAG: hypothetical protein ACXWBN_17195 [Acidimicrobiales bacterium]